MMNEHTSAMPPQPRQGTARPGRAGAAALSVLLFFTVALNGSFDTSLVRWGAFFSGVFLLLLMFRPAVRRMIPRAAAPAVFAFLAYILLNGISTFYAVAPKFAIQEFSKILVAFAVYAAVLFKTQRSLPGMRRVMSIFAAVSAAFGLISIDAASCDLLGRAFRAVMLPFTSLYESKGGFNVNRIDGVFGNSNTLASITAVGIFLALYLLLTSRSRGEHFFAAGTLLCSSYAFLMAFSLGGTFAFAVSCAAFLFFCKKEERSTAFVLMFETAVITLVMTGVSLSGFGHAGEAVSFLPYAALAAGVLVLGFSNMLLRDKVRAALEGRGRLIALLVAGLILLVAVYLVLGFTIHGSLTVRPGDAVYRTVYPAAGENTLTLSADGAVDVRVMSQNEEQIVLQENTVLYSGTYSEPIVYTVPEDAMHVRILFTAPDGRALVEHAEFSDGAGAHEIALGYKLLPSIIADRLQGLRTNYSAIQRSIYLKDGMKIFAKSPVFGRGLGAFENGILSVQTYHYETKYPHNYFVQLMTDLGVVGLLSYAALLVLSALALWRRRKAAEGEADFSALTAPLAGALAMILIHGASEISMSSGEFLPFAFAVFALIACLDRPVSGQEGRAALAAGCVRWGTAAFAALFVCLIGGNLYAKSRVSSAQSVTFDALQQCANVDLFEKNDYMLSYVLAAPQAAQPAVLTQANKYAEQLSKVESNSIPLSLSQFYFATAQPEQGFAMLQKSIDYITTKDSTWVNAFNQFEQVLDPLVGGDAAVQRVFSLGDYLPRMMDFYDQLVSYNADVIKPIALTPRNYAFIARLKALEAAGAEDSTAHLNIFSRMLIDSKYAPDIDGDGASDLFETLSGTDRVLTDGTLTASAPVKVRCEFTPNTSGTYEIALRTSTPELVTGMSCTDLADGGRMFLPDDVTAGDGAVTAQMKIGSAFTTSYALEFECAAGARVDEILITRVG